MHCSPKITVFLPMVFSHWPGRPMGGIWPLVAVITRFRSGSRGGFKPAGAGLCLRFFDDYLDDNAGNQRETKTNTSPQKIRTERL